MANKTFQLKLTPRYERQMDYLILTHRIFNESLVYVMRKIKDMAKKDANPHLKTIYHDMMKLSLRDEIDKLQKQLEGIPSDDEKKELENKIKKLQNKRNQGAQDAARWLDKITNPNAHGVKKDNQVSESAKAAIKSLAGHLLYNRLNILPYQGNDYSFRSMLCPRAARRILNNEVNEGNHKKLLKQAEVNFEQWKNKPYIKEKWTEFQEAKEAFESEWQKCERQPRHDPAKCYCICHKDNTKPCDQYIIDGATIRGWMRFKHQEGILDLLKEEKNITRDKAIAIIDKFQTEHKRDIGNVNFFKWLADKPHLWDWVRTMKEYNDHQFIIRKLSRPIAFTYPRWNNRPEWLEYSLTSPMPKSFEINLPNKEVSLLVFVPIEDIPALRKADLLVEDRATKKIHTANTVTNNTLVQRIDFNSYQQVPDKIPTEVRGWFKQDPPLDLSRFILCKIRYNFTPDKRLKKRSRQGSFRLATDVIQKRDGTIKETKTKYPTIDYEYSLESLKDLAKMPETKKRYAKLQLSNAKLVFKGIHSPRQAMPYLYLTADIQIPKLNLVHLKRQKKAEGGTQIPKDDDLVTLAIDLGQRFTATCTVVKFNKGKLPEPLKPLAVRFIRLPGMELPSLQQHDDQKRKLQRITDEFLKSKYKIKPTRLPKGKLFARRLTEHIDHLKEDRYKKSGHQILKLALKYNVGEILFENLTGFNPTQDYEHSVNRRLRNWNRREVVEWVKTLVKPYDINVYDSVSANYTSQICYRCGKVGARFAHITNSFARLDAKRKKPAGAFAGKRQVVRGGPLFACPHCRKIVNADLNSSLNLNRVLALTYKGFVSQSGLPVYPNEDKRQREERKKLFRQTECKTQTFLNEHFKQGDTPPLWAERLGWGKEQTNNSITEITEHFTKSLSSRSDPAKAGESPQAQAPDQPKI